MLRSRSVAVAVLVLLVGLALATAKDVYPYAGNTRSKKFHRETCQYYACTNCTAKFRTREEAIEAGYTPGGCCRP